MAARSFAYHAHGTADPMVCVPWQNIKSAMHACSGSPPDDKSSYKFYNGSLHCSDVGPYPRATGNYACPREHAFRKCAFREKRIKYNTRKCALSKVQALNSSEPSVLSHFPFFWRWSNFLKPKFCVMPISGCQIELEHPPFDSTALIGLKMSFWKFTFNLFLPKLHVSCFNLHSERAMSQVCICLDFSAVASFPASL